MPYLPQLDGLRAVAVAAVLLFHGGVAWAGGGFLGVEVFFVLSGYLITSLLLAEWRETGRAGLKAFWLRRARRLLPELFAVLAAVLVYALLFLPEEVARLRTDTAAAAGYVMNWRLALGEESYFESWGRPSLLQHLWSLAVEEQFYLFWPPLFALLIARVRPRGMLALAIAGAAVAAVLMGLLHASGADPSRLYYGTDTRASGVLLGAALAFAWAPWRRPAAVGRWRRGVAEAVGLAALAVLIAAFHSLDEASALLYRGGFLGVGLATAVLIAAAAHPAAKGLAGVLGAPPLRWMGTRSYGIYLWHWPVYAITRPGLDVELAEPWLLALRVAVTFALAELSYRFVYGPVRSGALGRWWHALRRPRSKREWSLRPASIAATFLTVGLALLTVSARSPASGASLQPVSFRGIVAAQTEVPPTATPTAAPSAVTLVPGASGTEGPALPDTSIPEAETPTAEATPPPAPAPPPPPLPKLPPAYLAADVLAIGDSVMVGAAWALGRAGTVNVDAEVGRQASSLAGIVAAHRKLGPLPPVVLIHIGNNGTVTRSQLQQVLDELEGVRQVVFVNVKVERSWESGNNAVIGAMAGGNVTVVDWHGASEGHSELFAADGVHLTAEGADLYARLIAAAIRPPPPPPTPTPSPAPTPTAIPTPTVTGTPSATGAPPSATPSATGHPSSATPSATGHPSSATPSATGAPPSATPSATRTPPGTPSQTPTATSTATPASATTPTPTAP